MGCGKSKAAADGPEKKDDAPAKPKEAPFAFVSGLPDCCTSNPDNYKVVAELPNARLVEMTLPVGQEDKPHDHPGHSMYVIQGGKLAITAYGEDGKAGATNEVEIPSGAPPIFPAGAHQVKNVGDTEVKIVFVEPLPACKPCEDVAGYLSPFKVAPQCYEVLAENDEWYTGMMTMDVGAQDPIHHHKDHLIYVLGGDQVTIFPGGDESAAMAVDIKVGAGIPAPMEAPPFAKHSLKNTGTTPLKMLFFEMK